VAGHPCALRQLQHFIHAVTMVVVMLGRYSALLWCLALVFDQGSSAAHTHASRRLLFRQPQRSSWCL
jgi:hypothetical protein